MRRELSLLFTHPELMTELVRKGIRLKYRHSWLGIAWSLFEPILSITVLVIVFGTLLGHKEPAFVMYVACGRLLYSFFSDGSRAACTAIRSNSDLLKKVYVPKIFLPLAEVFWRFIVFLISLLVLIPLSFILHIPFSSAFLWVIPALLLLLLLTCGTGLILCVGNVFLRDVEFLWKVLLSIIMYLSAIFYNPAAILLSPWGFLLKLNPLFSIIQMFRAGFSCADLSQWIVLYPIAFSVGLLLAAFILYEKGRKKLVLYL